MRWVTFLRGYAGLALCLVAPSARAEHRGFYVNNFAASPAGSRWFSLQSANWKAPGTLSTGLVFDYGSAPVAVYDSHNDRTVALVTHQAFVHLNGSLRLGERFQLVVSSPLLLATGGHNVTVGSLRYDAPSGIAFADLRLQGNVLILGNPDSAFQLFGGVIFWAPTGNAAHFTGNESVRLGAQLAATGRISLFNYAAESNVRWAYKGQDFGDYTFGSSWHGTLALGVEMFERRLTLGPELIASTALNNLFGRTQTPVEAVLGTHFEHDEQWLFGLGIGMGITRGLGAPEYRCLLAVQWSTEPPKAAPNAPPTPSALPPPPSAAMPLPLAPAPAAARKTNTGPTDVDEDGVLDGDDVCPIVPGVASQDPTRNGCPPKDQDGDGIFDPIDACANVWGVASNDATKHGCPAPADSDSDGIADTEDACPKLAGIADPDPKLNGCPKAALSGSKIDIHGRIEFENRSDALLVASEPVLVAVLDVLKQHPEIVRLNVEGHTDNRGSAQGNLQLSQRRAKAVVSWLIARGIEPARLTPRGLGPNEPIDTNDSEAGRRNNRRVEFVIVKFNSATPGANP